MSQVCRGQVSDDTDVSGLPDSFSEASWFYTQVRGNNIYFFTSFDVSSQRFGAGRGVSIQSEALSASLPFFRACAQNRRRCVAVVCPSRLGTTGRWVSKKEIVGNWGEMLGARDVVATGTSSGGGGVKRVVFVALHDLLLLKSGAGRPPVQSSP